MIDRSALAGLSDRLAFGSAPPPPPAWDRRLDGEDLSTASEARLDHVRHQALMRAYQSRYVLLPPTAPAGSTLAGLRRHHAPETRCALDRMRPFLEDELIRPRLEAARLASADVAFGAYVEAMIPSVRQAPETAFTAYLRTASGREAHYRNFLLQASADLSAEASASAFGVIGEFGAPQSALFRILIDEFGYGTHDRKHSVLYSALMRDFGLPEAYNAGWPLFDTAALALHNTIHCLFQNPEHIFLQVGFLLFAETAYQRSTRDHFRYLGEFHPRADARYFSEHAHIDLHHSRMVVDEVAAPMIAAYGPEVGAEIVAGAELTRAALQEAGDALLAVSRAFDAAVEAGDATFQTPSQTDLSGTTALVTPDCGPDRAGGAPVQVGGLGRVHDSRVFATFPAGAVGRVTQAPA